MIRTAIETLVAHAVATLHEAGQLPQVTLPVIEIGRPQYASHGDYTTNVALKLAAAVRAATGAKGDPRALAETIAAQIRETAECVPAYDLVGAVEVAGPGFINLRLADAWLLRQVRGVLDAGETFGATETGRQQRVNLEFVSANPTGPVTVGNGRGAFIGDTLASVMRAAGFAVAREYYFNDAGAQVAKLGRSMEYYLRLANGDADAERPEEGYFGPYYEAIAGRLLAGEGRALLDAPPDVRAEAIGKAAAASIMADIQHTMTNFGIAFDVWFNEADLVHSGARQEGIEALRAAGYIEERDGALWARTTAFGDDKDRVVLRSDGVPTYYASDVAYMRDKFARGFERLILVLGPDHHGYIARLKAAAGMLGHSPEDVQVLMYQQVNVKVGGRSERMGKRLGNAITLDELYEEVGADVTRFFYVMRANDTHLDFDLELARKQSDENPGLSVQYAHARICSVFRKASERGFAEALAAPVETAVLLADAPDQLARELDLVRTLLRLEEVVERVALSLEPHHLTRYASELADAFHLFYDACPILKSGVEITPEVRAARLHLMRAAQVGLARTLGLLGMAAPERMERQEAVAE